MKQDVKQTVIVKIGNDAAKKKKGKGKKKKTKQTRAPFDAQAVFNYRPILSVPPPSYGGFSGPNHGPTYGQQYDQLNKKIDLLQDMFNQTNTRIDLSDEATMPAPDDSFEFVSAPSPPEPSPPPRQRVRMEDVETSPIFGNLDEGTSPFTFDTPQYVSAPSPPEPSPPPQRVRMQDAETSPIFTYDDSDTLTDYVDESPDRIVSFGGNNQPTPSPPPEGIRIPDAETSPLTASPEPNQQGLLTPELLTNRTPQGFAGSGTFDASREASDRRRRDPVSPQSLPVRNLNFAPPNMPLSFDAIDRPFRNSEALNVFSETIPTATRSNAETQINPITEDVSAQTDIFNPISQTPSVKRSPLETSFYDDTPITELPTVQKIRDENISYREVKSTYDRLSAKKKKEYLSDIRSELGKPAGDKSTLKKLVSEIESILTEDMPGPSTATSFSPLVVESNPMFSFDSPEKRQLQFDSSQSNRGKTPIPYGIRKLKASDVTVIKTQPMDVQRGRSLQPLPDVDTAKGIRLGKKPKK